MHAASGRVVAMLAWLVLTPPLVRALGPDGFGVWSLFYAMSGWLSTLDLGFAQMTLRFSAAARARDSLEQTGEYATLAVLGYLVLGTVWLSMAVLLSTPALDLLRIQGVAREWTAQAFVAGAIVFVVAGITITTTSTLQAWNRFDLANAVTLTVSLAQVGLLGWAIAVGAEIWAYFAAVIAAWVVALGVGLVLLSRGAPDFKWSSLPAAVRRLPPAVKFGLPLQAANAVGVAHQQSGKLLMVRMVGLASVVPYELGLRVSSACFAYAQLLIVSMIPEASRLHARQLGPQLEVLYHRAGRFVTAAAAVLAAALLAVAPALFEAWLGTSDGAAALALRGLALASYASVVGGVSSAIARGVDRTGFELEWSIVGMLLHVVLGGLLIPGMGLTGALVAVAIANLVAALWFSLRLGRALGWRMGRLLWEPFAVPALAIAAGAWTGTRVTSWIDAPWLEIATGGVTACGVSAALLLGLRHVRTEELVSLLRRGAAA